MMCLSPEAVCFSHSREPSMSHSADALLVPNARVDRWGTLAARLDRVVWSRYLLKFWCWPLVKDSSSSAVSRWLCCTMSKRCISLARGTTDAQRDSAMKYMWPIMKTARLTQPRIKSYFEVDHRGSPGSADEVILASVVGCMHASAPLPAVKVKEPMIAVSVTRPT